LVLRLLAHRACGVFKVTTFCILASEPLVEPSRAMARMLSTPLLLAVRLHLLYQRLTLNIWSLLAVLAAAAVTVAAAAVLAAI
jgi:hypothetical protein